MSAALLTHIGPLVPARSRGLGAEYYGDGAVHELKGNPDEIRACVVGTEHYQVLAARRGDALEVSCSCPYHVDTAVVCKHIWAALLAAATHPDMLLGPHRTPPRSIGVLDDATGEPGPIPPAPPPATWKDDLQFVSYSVTLMSAECVRPWPPGRVVHYLIDVPQTLAGRGLAVEVACRDPLKDGTTGKLRTLTFSSDDLPAVPDALDRENVALLRASHFGSGYRIGYDALGGMARIPDTLHRVVLPALCRTGRAHLRLQDGAEPGPPLHWDGAGAWGLRLGLEREADGGSYRLEGHFERGAERLAMAEPLLLIAGGLLFTGDRVAPLDDASAFPWIVLLRKKGRLAIPAAEVAALLDVLEQVPRLPPLSLPAELQLEEVRPAPSPCLRLRPPGRLNGRLQCELTFDYDGLAVPDGARAAAVRDRERRRLVWRDSEAEERFRARLAELGFRWLRNVWKGESRLQLTPRHLQRVVPRLVAEGWQVEAQGKLYRNPGAFRVEVATGIDWFELKGTVEFGEARVDLPALLQAVRKGETSVLLDDGTIGLLPQEWLRQHRLLAASGSLSKDGVRFRHAQGALLDALLAGLPEASCDDQFARLRAELGSFAGLQAVGPGSRFHGTLRSYQEEGLSWLLFLERSGLGGCLADDMGLGKTVQVLALLAGRRERTESAGERPGPALVVAPRSLVFHWKNECHRFAPALSVLDHTGQERGLDPDRLGKHDLVVTTYGTLRRDILALKDVRFDYCILDEAQAIKNAATDTAKAVRLLQARHRLAVSGTPIENHLGELWSLFEFLNPGMFGQVSVFQRLTAAGRDLDAETAALLRRALRPFILRRTKQAVEKDLPEKLEDTVFCELGPVERELYDELRDHYRRALLGRIEREGLKRSKIQVLEALLRLRQAACHPGLLDPRRRGEASAKLEALLADLAEVVEEGHKALVFSQFTRLLAIVRDRLERAGLRYEYLDGKTRDREARVARFQTDPNCLIFLISLKAGGLGLNLTAADYVFLLDPWWNPAVEAQAVDRSHRIGQTRRVFAYRLIARGTVEERVLELQDSKRHLADAILTEDAGLLRRLEREDLELLLS